MAERRAWRARPAGVEPSADGLFGLFHCDVVVFAVGNPPLDLEKFSVFRL